MGSYQIDLRFDDGSRRRCRQVSGDLGEACGVALALAEEQADIAADAPDVGHPARVELWEGALLHLSISILPDGPRRMGKDRRPGA